MIHKLRPLYMILVVDIGRLPTKIKINDESCLIFKAKILLKSSKLLNSE